MTFNIKQATTSNAIDDAIVERQSTQRRRGHLGYSTLCNPDMRETWLKFRWCLPDDFTPRVLRIFELGHSIESIIISNLRMISGVTIHEFDPVSGKQFNFSSFGGHVGGSMDGAIVGLPESPKTWHVFEAKSAKDSEFKKLKKLESYKEWNATYYGQVQCYMGESGMNRAVVIVYNKDTSELYIERIKSEPGFFENAKINAQDILELEGPPDSAYGPKDYRIVNIKKEKWQRIYRGDELPDSNCRNCIHSRIEQDGNARWHCRRWQKDLTLSEQMTGCNLHLYLPALMPARMLEVHSTLVRYKTSDGLEFWNSEDKPAAPGQHVYSSDELRSISESDGICGKFMNDPIVNEIRNTFEATIESI